MQHTFSAGFLFCGSGLAAMGAAQASGALGLHTARCRIVGGIDNDPLCAEDFTRFTGAPCTVADVSKMQTADLIAALGPEAPDVLVATPPCKGFSRLISRAKAATPKYQALNKLVLQGIELALTTWADRPPPIILLENVEGIRTSGAELLAQVRSLLLPRDYSIDEDTHCAGEIGELAQRRRRFLMVARHRPQVPQLLYKPRKHRVRACGEVLGPLPLPNDPAAGPLHLLPEVSFLTWVRLAEIRAGHDWHDLPRKGPAALHHKPRRGTMKVARFDAPSDTVRGRADVRTGPAAVADPIALQERLALGNASAPFNDILAVRAWSEPAKAVTTGTAYVADEKVADLVALTHSRTGRFSDQYRVQAFERPAATVTGATDVQVGAPIIADPKVAELLALGRTGDNAVSSGWKGRPGLMGVLGWDKPAATVTGKISATGSCAPASVADPITERFANSLRVIGWGQPAGAVTAGTHPSNGVSSVADPIAERLGVDGAYRNTTLGVTPWWMPAPTVTGSAQVDNGAFSVGQPLPSPPFPPGYVLFSLEEARALLVAGWAVPKGIVPVIVAPDGTWHRPLTLLELAVLQSMPATWEGKPLTMAGRSRAKIAEHIGNGLPGGTMKATMGEMMRTLLAARVGSLFMDGELEVWVDPQREEMSA